MSVLKNRSIKKSLNKENEKILEAKEYQISSSDSDFSLKVEIDNKYIYFSVYESNKIFNYVYRNNYELSKIIAQLNLVQAKYTSLPKVLRFIDKAYSKNKITIEQEYENEISLNFEIPVDYEEDKFSLKLKKKKLEDKELLPILVEQINRLNNNNKIVKNKFNEIEKQINSISRKNTGKISSGGSDINEEINIIKQQLNDINMKLTGAKTTTNKTRNNHNDRFSANKFTISKNTENDLYNNTYKTLKRKKSETFEEEEDDKFIFEKNKNKKYKNNERYSNNNEEEEVSDKNDNNRKRKKASKEKNKNGSIDDNKDIKKSIKKSRRDSNEIKKSKRYINYNINNENDNEIKSNSQKLKKSKLRSGPIYAKEKNNINNLNNNDKEDNNDISSSNNKNYNNEKKYVYNKNNNINNETKLSENTNKFNQSSKNNNDLKNGNVDKTNSIIINNKNIENGNINPYKINYVKKNKKEIEDYSNKINYVYNSSPIKFKYKTDVCKTNTSCGWNDMFEVYISYKNNKEYLASPDNNNFNINIISLKDNKVEKSLEGHKNRVRTIRYFINENTNNENNDEINENRIIYEYLISADDNHIVIVWDLINDYEIKQTIDTNYEDDIYSCLIFFNNENISQSYIITSSYSTSNDIQNSATKIYSLETGKYVFHIKESNFDNIYYLLLWYNKKNNINYLIQFSYKNIIINNLDPRNNEPYAKLINEPENEHYSGFIYNKDDTELLCTSCYNGFIHIWDLYSKKIVKVIDTKCILCHIIQWSNKFVIAADFGNKSFIIVDIDKKKIYNEINPEHTMEVKCVKKFLHPKYGECLLTAGRDNSIKLWKL